MDQLRKDGDSCGARVDVVARGMPVGLGAPLYDKLDADIAYAMMGINAVKGVEIGAGFAPSTQRGTTTATSSRRRLRRQQRRRRARRHLDRQDLTRLDRDQADQLDPQPAPLDRPPGKATVVETLGRHDPASASARADRRGDAGAGRDGPRAAHRAQCGDVDVATPPIPARSP
jgi:chorismate synthase